MTRVLLPVAVALVTACVKPATVDRTEVVGTYVLYVHGDHDELTLRADGTYRHLVPSRFARTPRVDEGKWTLESGPPTRLSLAAFDPWWSQLHTGPVLYSTFFERGYEGRLMISNADEAPAYTKQ